MREPPTRWSEGDHAVLRFVGHDNRILMGYPQIVVEDSDEHVILFHPAGATVENTPYTPLDRRAGRIPGREFPPTYNPPLDVLRILPAGAAHAIEVYFAFDGQPSPPYLPWARGDATFRGVKINLQAPFRRTALGLDTTDNTLDVSITPDLEWSWKDVGQVEARVAAGLTYPEEAAAFRAEAERVIADLDARRSYFTDDLGEWRNWRPDPAWTAPALPVGWTDEPGYDLDLNRR
jgi:hypothetical protein